MNRFFRTWGLYSVLALVTLVLLGVLTRVEREMETRIAGHRLRFTGRIENAPPLVAFTTVALGSFRGLIADMLWLRAGGLQAKGSYYEMVQIARWIMDLQPTFSGAAAYLGWNMAYNISVTCSDFADRWRWVNEGIRLLRDQALRYNPEDPVLYKDLAWIFQHKLGNYMDDAHQYYKVRLAMSISEILQGKEDFADWIAVPGDPGSFEKAFGRNEKFLHALSEAGYPDAAGLYEAFAGNKAELPPAFVQALRDAELVRRIDAAFRVRLLYDRFRLDVKKMHELNLAYGRLDWRLPEAQAIYWAKTGLEKTPGGKDIHCERIVAQSLYEAFRSGRLLMADRNDFSTVTTAPNLDLADAVKRTMEKGYEDNDRQITFLSAKINFMKEAVVMFFRYGKFQKAGEYFKELSEIDGEVRKYPDMEAFVMSEFREEVQDANVKKAGELVENLVWRSCYYLALNDPDAALANERMARYVYNAYTAKIHGAESRLGLPPYREIKKAVTESCLRYFPPAMSRILQSRIEEERGLLSVEPGSVSGTGRKK